ncbi:MAG: LamG domain-containing protein, partial [Candidatus Aenigmatarchaeota archaeon]
MKAITPVISLIMLMLVTVGIVGVSYTWFSGLMASNTEKIITIPPGGAQCYNSKINVLVRNSGTASNITDDDIVVADINGVSVRNTLFFGNFNQSGLVGYWRFEQSNGSAATNDSSGYGNMGTLTNMNLTGNATSGLTTNGRFGNALVFDGVNDYVSLPSSSSLEFGGKNIFTIESWVKWNGVGHNYQLIVDLGAYDLFFYLIGGIPSVTFYYGPASAYTAQMTGSFSSDMWYHLVATYDGSNLRLYKNGVSGSPVSTGGVLVRDFSNTNRIGNSVPGDMGGFNGAIDEVQVWNRVLSPEEILQLNKTGSGNFTIG